MFLPDKGGGAAHEAGKPHHQYCIRQLDMPNPMLLAYATTKGAIQNFTGGLAQMLAEKGIRANAVAPGPIWTPLIPSTMPDDTAHQTEC
jgi:NAD(P)-dependent dehydrogenase (short-subunit alcohol dehydrogenase family)